jgi:2-polyprenyl-3-methyl-5-hydroxy-6-metoxy-1,4-benzoquinol methylase
MEEPAEALHESRRQSMAQTSPHYVLGHSDAELKRLQLQSIVYSGITRRMIRDCGIEPGMRVLDIGSGAGDVAMLIADAVGPSGKVVAIDREPRAVDAARNRVQEAGYKQIECIVATDEALPRGLPFDAAVGRFVLVHQTDPTATVRRAAAAVRPGGIVAFQEPAMLVPSFIFPTIEIQRAFFAYPHWPAVIKAFVSSPDVAGRMVRIFEVADLPDPQSVWESVLGDHGSDLVTLYAMGLTRMQPIFAHLKIAPPDLGDPETLADRLRAQMAEADARLLSTPQAGVWARRA